MSFITEVQSTNLFPEWALQTQKYDAKQNKTQTNIFKWKIHELPFATETFTRIVLAYSDPRLRECHTWNMGTLISSLTLFESCFQVKSVDSQNRVINWSKLLQLVSCINKHDYTTWTSSSCSRWYLCIINLCGLTVFKTSFQNHLSIWFVPMTPK